jgi:hypothetical protein
MTDAPWPNSRPSPSLLAVWTLLRRRFGALRCCIPDVWPGWRMLETEISNIGSLRRPGRRDTGPQRVRAGACEAFLFCRRDDAEFQISLREFHYRPLRFRNVDEQNG